MILEYLEETQPRPLHPADPLQRAEHRAWMEFGSSILMDIWNFYVATDEATFEAKRNALTAKFERLEQRLSDGPYFDGARFSLVDAVFGPVFRYFDTFDRIADFGMLADKPRLAAWRHALAQRPSIARAGDAGLSRAPVAFPRGARFQAVGHDGESGVPRTGRGSVRQR